MQLLRAQPTLILIKRKSQNVEVIKVRKRIRERGKKSAPKWFLELLKN